MGNVDISNANIGTLTVGSSNISEGAVTSVDHAVLGSDTFAGIRDCSVTAVHGNKANNPGLRVKVEGYALYSTSEDDGGGATDPRPVTFSLVNATDGDTMVSFAAQPKKTNSIIPLSFSEVFIPPNGRNSTVFRVRLNSGYGTAHRMRIICTSFKK